MSEIPHEVSAGWALAHALQTMSKVLRPKVRAAYRAEIAGERREFAQEAVQPALSVLGTVIFAAYGDQLSREAINSVKATLAVARNEAAG